MIFRIIYLWRGERHVHLTDFITREAASEVLAAYRDARWNAWIERIK